jgi:hypothetical protein
VLKHVEYKLDPDAVFPELSGWCPWCEWFPGIEELALQDL